MTTIYIESESATETQQLVRSAIKGEISRLEMALAMAQKRLHPFEEKYGISSTKFISEMTAEDLDGGDDEYVQWAGEYQLMKRLEHKLKQLWGIKYGDSSLFRTN